MDVDVLREPAEAVQVRRRQGRDAEDRHATAGASPPAPARQRAERGILDPGAMRLGGARDERAPERRLPAVVGARLPARDPLRAIDEVLVEEVGDARGELVAAALVGGAQVRAERLEPRSVVQAVQDRPQVPDRHPALERVETPGRAAARCETCPTGSRREAGSGCSPPRRARARGGATASAPSPGSARRRSRARGAAAAPRERAATSRSARSSRWLPRRTESTAGSTDLVADAVAPGQAHASGRRGPSRPFLAAPTHRPSWHRPCEQGQQGRSGR